VQEKKKKLSSAKKPIGLVGKPTLPPRRRNESSSAPKKELDSCDKKKKARNVWREGNSSRLPENLGQIFYAFKKTSPTDRMGEKKGAFRKKPRRGASMERHLTTDPKPGSGEPDSKKSRRGGNSFIKKASFFGG